jgi:antitoxin YefM
MARTIPVRELRTHLSELLDEVAHRREHVTITRRGRPSAVLIPVDEYAALEETADVLSDDETLAAIRQGLSDIAADDVAALDDVRAEFSKRSPS